MRMHPAPENPDCSLGNCDACGQEIARWRGDGDLVCAQQNPGDCPAIYNAFGQRLRDDLFSKPNMSERDDDIDDMAGYEDAMNRYEAYVNQDSTW